MASSGTPRLPEKALRARERPETNYRTTVLDRVSENERRLHAMATIQDDDERMLMRIGYKQVRNPRHVQLRFLTSTSGIAP